MFWLLLGKAAAKKDSDKEMSTFQKIAVAVSVGSCLMYAFLGALATVALITIITLIVRGVKMVIPGL